MVLCRLRLQVISILLSITYVHNVNGAQPHAMGEWSINSGVIQSDCPENFDCSSVISESAGFIQQRLIDQNNGEAFIQTIIGSPAENGLSTTLSHASESLVRVSSSTQPGMGEGISFQQHISENDSGPFVMDVNYNSGWASFDRSAHLEINNEIHDPGQQTGAEFKTVSHLMVNNDVFGERTGARIAISQNISLGAFKTTTTETEEEASIMTTTRGQFDPTERDVFVLRLADGDLITENPLEDVRLWIYHWKSTGLDERQGKRGPLGGQWFYCESSMGEMDNGCASWSKHEAIPVPDKLPFDQLPFDAAMTYHSREEDESLYPVLAKLNGRYDSTASIPAPTRDGNAEATSSPHPSLPAGTLAVNDTLLFGGWSASIGEISVVCPDGYSCDEVSSGKGFIQMSLKDNASGDIYYQVIVTERNAGGDPVELPFSSESLVRAAQLSVNNNKDGAEISGIAARLLMNDSSNDMTSSSIIKSGWANAGNDPAIKIMQGAPYTSFTYTANRDDMGNRTGYKTNIYQDAENLSFNKAANEQHLEDQKFVHREVVGDMLTSSGYADFPGGRSLSWEAGDDVKVTLMKQRIRPGLEGGQDTGDGSGDTALDWNQGYGGPQLAYISYDNYSDNTDPMTIVSPDKAITRLWKDSPFGSSPF